LNADRNWLAVLYYADAVTGPGASRPCVVGSGDAMRVDCPQGEALTVREMVIPGLRPDSSGCVDIFLELQERGNRPSDARQSAEVHWISLMRIKPEHRETESGGKSQNAVPQ
jgi:hypothetical protein